MKTLIISFILVFSLIFSLVARPIVDKSEGLTLISNEFDFIDGAAWDGQYALYIPDLKAGKLYRYVPTKKELKVFAQDTGRISGTFYQSGKLYLSDNGEGNMAILDFKTKKKKVLKGQTKTTPPEKPNDLCVDKFGGVYYTLTRPGQVIYISPEGSKKIVAENIDRPNGIVLSPSGKHLYVSEVITKKIMRFEVSEDGQLSAKTEFAKMNDQAEKGADGMCVDRAGNVYCAGWSDIWIWNPEGKLLDKIACPERPINCTFGGKEFRTLYIVGLGGLYSQKMNTYGLPPQKPHLAEDVQANSKRPSTVWPKGLKAELEVVYAKDGARELRADIFSPTTKNKNKPCLLIVHGGGWKGGDKQKFRALALEMASRGYVTAAVEYRLAYEAAFPKAIHDLYAAVRFMKAHADHYEIDVNKIGAIGGSAGGHLVGLMTTGHENAQLLGNYGNTDQNSKIAAGIVMAGPMEIISGSVAEKSKTAEQNSNAYLWFEGTLSEKRKLYELADAHIKIDANDPPLLFMVGEHDNPARNQPSRDALKKAGVWTGLKVYEKGKHGCWNQLPWFTDMTEDMDQFFKAQFSN